MATRNAFRDEIRGRDPVLTVYQRGGRVFCERCRLADRPLARLRGLLGRRSLGFDQGLLLFPAGAIHTAFMRFPIDAVFLDQECFVLHIAHDLASWRAAAKLGARAVLEIPAGTARLRGLELDERLLFVSRDDAVVRERKPILPPRNISEAELVGFAGPQGR
ncbi:MAG: DUF192 domain-containing protein [Gaiellaceae bacterium]